MHWFVRAVLWFYAIGFGLGALLSFASEPLLAVCFGAASALCAWCARRPSPESLTALAVLPLLIAPGVLPLADPDQRRGALLALLSAEVLWGGLCLWGASRLRRRASAP
jgi:hypothetical protein